MRLLWAHDHIFYFDKESNYFSTGKLPYSVWERYLKSFSSVRVVSRGKELNSQEHINRVTLSSGPNVSFLTVPSISNPLSYVKRKNYVERLLRDEIEAVDVVIARLPSEIGSIAIKVARSLGKPYLVEVVACAWDALWNYGSLEAKIYAPIACLKMKQLVLKSPYAIYVTNDFLQKRYPSRGRFTNISNVEIQTVDEKVLGQKLNNFSKVKKMNKIGMIGSLDNKMKGLEVALNALSELKKRNVKFEFQIVGDGDSRFWKAQIENLGIENEVKFIGVLPGGEPIMKWLDNIDLYIQPSFQEGLPRAVIEAMSRACPVVGSSAGGIPELINQQCLHQPGDYKNLASIIERIMLDIKEAVHLSEQNFEEAKKYRSEYLNKKRQDFFQEIISGI